MDRDQLHIPKLIVQAFSILGCFAGIALLLPLYSFFGLDIEQCLNSLGAFIRLLFVLIISTVFGYYSFSFVAAYSMVLLNVVSKEQVAQLDIGGKKVN